jgi:uncharacterized alpha-E superfamily protein
VNRNRDEDERVLLVLDGVHGLGAFGDTTDDQESSVTTLDRSIESGRASGEAVGASFTSETWELS